MIERKENILSKKAVNAQKDKAATERETNLKNELEDTKVREQQLKSDIELLKQQN